MRILLTGLCLYFFSVFVLNAQSNEGTNFWCGFMEHIDINQNTKVAMITSKQNTSGTISVPGQDWQQSFNVAANDVTLITLPSSTETRGSESISNTGINIQSIDPVSVYIHQYISMRSEASIVLPVETLGSEYFTMTYEGYEQEGDIYPSEFLVVATQDETSITITVSDRTRGGRNAGSRISVTLNAGDTYQVQAAVGSGDLTGSKVVGDKPFALFSGNSWTEVPVGCGFRDNLLEQMYPVDAFGRRFVTVPNASVTFDVFRILASEDNTRIEVRGLNTIEYELDAGEFVEYSGAVSTYIVANKPIVVAQFNVGASCNGHTLGDPSMVVLNSIEQTRDTVTLFNSRFEAITENYINIITRTADADFVTFDGTPLVSQGVDFFPVAGNPDYSFARVFVNAGAHTIISEGCGVIATAYGYGNVESYAYSGGASFSKINANPIPEGGCLNDTIFFNTGLSPVRYNFTWDLGDGTTSTEARFQKFYGQLGSYPVQLVLEDECLETIDTLIRELQVTLRQAVDALPEIQICEEETLSLSATDLDGARYLWRGPNGFLSEEQFPNITEATFLNAGSYGVVGNVSGCATFPAFTMVEVLALPQPNLINDTLICFRDYPLGFTLNAGSFPLYRWNDGSLGEELTVFQRGIYTIEVEDDFGCIGEDMVEIKEQCPTQVFAPNAFSPNQDGINDTFKLLGTDVESLHLQIFDRWGSLIFETFDKDKAWNGRYKGEWMGTGTYVWTALIGGFDENGDPTEERISGTVQLVK